VVTVKASACNGGHADQQGYVVLMANGQVVSFSEGPGSEIMLVSDVDGDSLREIIATDGGTWQGTTLISAGTFTFKNGKATSIEYVNGIVHNDNCGANGRTREIAAVFFTRDSGGVLQKNYVKRCGAPNSDFKFYSNGPLEE
jgi:hypothetical protein